MKKEVVVSKALVALLAVAGIGVGIAYALSVAPAGGVTYLLTRSTPAAAFEYGITTLATAISHAQNYSNANNVTVYIYNSNGALVQTVTPIVAGGSFTLEIFDINGNRTLMQTYSTLAAAQAYIAANYTIVPPPGIGATGTFSIYDGSSALVDSGYIR